MSTLRIHNWCNEYQVPLDHPAPEMLGRDLDRLVPRLANSLGEHLDTLFAGETDSIVLLPALLVDCGIDSNCPPEQIVSHWARCLALALVRAINDPASGSVRFPSRAAYYARFIGELAHGRACDGWLYRGFDGLRVLPAAAAIRTLLTAEAATGQAALALLDDATWPLLLDLLTPREALRILRSWHENGQLSSTFGSDTAQPAAWAASLPALPGAIASPLLALWLLARWRRALPATATLPVPTACWLAALLSLPEEIGSLDLQGIARRTDVDAVRDRPQFSADADWLLLLSTTPAADRETAATLASSVRAANATAQSADTNAASLAAPFAGLAWLLPALLELLNTAVVDTLPSAGDGQPLDRAALLTLAVASGSRGEQVWRDSFWRSFLHLPPTLGATELNAWLAAHDPAPVHEALALALCSRAIGDRVGVRFRHAGVRVEQIVERASACRLNSGPPPSAFRGLPLPLGERLALTRLLRQDARFLATSPLLATLPGAWRDIFVTLAQATLRRTSNRIPGTARCSLPYFFANVLGVRGQARQIATPPAEDWSLELARPPLYVLLSLNGMARRRLTWPGSRSLALHCLE